MIERLRKLSFGDARLSRAGVAHESKKIWNDMMEDARQPAPKITYLTDLSAQQCKTLGLQDLNYLTPGIRNHFDAYVWGYSFGLKKGAVPSDALRSFFNGPTVADCTSVLDAVVYGAVLATVGEKQFNQIYKYGGRDVGARMWLAPECGPKGLLKHPLRAVAMFKLGLRGRVGRRWLRVGDCVYFQGPTDYLDKHPAGNFQGHHVMYVGDDAHTQEQLFIGYGMEQPLTEKQMNKFLLDSYHAPATEADKEKFEERKRWGVLVCVEHDASTPQQKVGFQPDTIRSVDIAAIKRLLRKAG